MNKLTAKELLFFIGAEVEFDLNGEKRTGILQGYDFWLGFQIFDKSSSPATHRFIKEEALKLKLRPITDMTWEEAKIFFNKTNGEILVRKNIYIKGIGFDYKWMDEELKPNTSDGFCHSGLSFHLCDRMSREQFKFLISRNFDVFDWVKDGLAIETTISQEEK